MQHTNNKPKVGVSACLLGDAVRYDGASKPNATVINKLSQIFELIAVCPEVEAGFGVPRPAVQLTEDPTLPNVTGRDDPSLDVTLALQDYCRQKIPQLKELSGFIFKSASPSCGLNSTPVYIDNVAITLNSRGLFARSVTRGYPQMAVIEDLDFTEQNYLTEFIEQVGKNHLSR